MKKIIYVICYQNIFTTQPITTAKSQKKAKKLASKMNRHITIEQLNSSDFELNEKFIVLAIYKNATFKTLQKKLYVE